MASHADEVYCDGELIESPVYYGLCTSEAQYQRERKRLGADAYSHQWLSDSASGVTHTMTNGKGGVCCLVCVRLQPDKVGINAACILVHEAVHVWQHIRAHLGEENPSLEFEAYCIDRIARNLMVKYANALRTDGVKVGPNKRIKPAKLELK